MYVDSCKTGKYVRHLLRKNYREDGKVKHVTVANISDCSEEEIQAIKLALKHKADLASLVSIKESIRVRQGLSVGAVWVLNEVAKRLGIIEAVGQQRDGKLALWQVLARLINQGSRLSAVRLAQGQAACDVLKMKGFCEDDLYRNLDWLKIHQDEIEDRLYERNHPHQAKDLFLYDVTSSYLEGTKNELGDFGYNRDGKRGKRQIVIGLLCDHEGEPISIEIFKGNTIDTQTFGRQVKKVAERFGGGEVTFVGDRGMIKGPQVADMVDVGGDEFHYITAITKPQIRKLLKDDVIQLGLFDQRLAEVTTDDGERYIMRRNPIRAEEMRSHREEKRKALAELVEKKNVYLAGHPRASVDVALRDVREYCDSRNLSDYVSIRCRDRVLEIDLDSEELSRIENLDGCYVLKTDLPADRIDKETVHDRYKDLTKVEQAFRECKTTHLELRPIYLRLADRTRAYGLVVMLAYIIRRELARCWADLDMTVEEGIDLLRELTAETVLVNGEEVCTIIPEPREDIRRLIELSGVPMPEMIPCRGERVATRKKLPKRKLRR